MSKTNFYTYDGVIMGCSSLNAGAAPFHPSNEPINICIYNDGRPSLTLVSDIDRYQILHNIEDQALDEAFPPSAQDSAELELVEIFVGLLAELDFMEEYEENNRRTFSGFSRRWEVRRVSGLQDRPRPALHSIKPRDHSASKYKSTGSILVSVHPVRRCNGMYVGNWARDSHSRRAKPNLTKIKTIQQPQKQH